MAGAVTDAPRRGPASDRERLIAYEAARLFLERARRARPNLVVDDGDAAPRGGRSAPAWTGSRWRWSWPRRGSAPCRSSGSPRARRRVPAADRRRPHGDAPPADAAGLDRVERRPARRRRAGRPAPPGRVPGTVHAGGRRSGRRRRRGGDRLRVLDVSAGWSTRASCCFDDTTGRYRLLETIRQFGLDRLRDGGELAARGTGTPSGAPSGASRSAGASTTSNRPEPPRPARRVRRPRLGLRRTPTTPTASARGSAGRAPTWDASRSSTDSGLVAARDGRRRSRRLGGGRGRPLRSQRLLGRTSFLDLAARAEPLPRSRGPRRHDAILRFFQAAWTALATGDLAEVDRPRSTRPSASATTMPRGTTPASCAAPPPTRASSTSWTEGPSPSSAASRSTAGCRSPITRRSRW